MKQQLYTANHLYPISIYDDRTGLHPILSFTQNTLREHTNQRPESV